MQPRIKRALDEFDQAAQLYAFKGTHSPERGAEVAEAYHLARTQLMTIIDKALREAYREGESDARSRAAYYPGLGDMGG